MINHQTPKPQIKWETGEIPVSVEFDDIYFNKKEPLQESQHVFIDGAELAKRWSQAEFFQYKKDYIIGELGFGFGLNFCNTLFNWKLYLNKQDKWLSYIAIEKYPLDVASIRRLAKRLTPLKIEFAELLKNYPFAYKNAYYISFYPHQCTLILLFKDVDKALDQLHQTDVRIDSWFCDGFNPSKNAEMWSVKTLHKLVKQSHLKTNLTSFSVSRTVKEHLQAVGFKVYKRKGFIGKREVLLALMSLEKKPLKPNRQKITQPSKIRIIGAGLAGLAVATSLAKHGVVSELWDLNRQVGMGCSHNPLLILKPKLNQEHDRRSQNLLQAFVFSRQVLQEILADDFEEYRVGCFDSRKKHCFGAPFYAEASQNYISIHNGFRLCSRLLQAFKTQIVFKQKRFFPEDNWQGMHTVFCTGGVKLDHYVDLKHYDLKKFFGASHHERLMEATPIKKIQLDSGFLYENKHHKIWGSSFNSHAFEPCRTIDALKYNQQRGLNKHSLQGPAVPSIFWEGIRVHSPHYQPVLVHQPKTSYFNGLGSVGLNHAFLWGEYLSCLLLNITPPLIYTNGTIYQKL